MTPLLFIEAGQLLPDVLVRGVEGPVNFLQTGRPKKEKWKKSNICYKFISWEITQARMDLNFSEPLCNPVGQNICESSSAGGAPLNNLIKRL